MDDQNQRKTLACATILVNVALEAIKEQQGASAFEALAAVLGNGTKSLGIFIQRDARGIYFAAAALAPERQQPFTDRLMALQGPAAESFEEIAGLLTGDRQNIH